MCFNTVRVLFARSLAECSCIDKICMLFNMFLFFLFFVFHLQLCQMVHPLLDSRTYTSHFVIYAKVCVNNKGTLASHFFGGCYLLELPTLHLAMSLQSCTRWRDGHKKLKIFFIIVSRVFCPHVIAQRDYSRCPVSFPFSVLSGEHL